MSTAATPRSHRGRRRRGCWRRCRWNWRRAVGDSCRHHLGVDVLDLRRGGCVGVGTEGTRTRGAAEGSRLCHSRCSRVRLVWLAWRPHAGIVAVRAGAYEASGATNSALGTGVVGREELRAATVGYLARFSPRAEQRPEQLLGSLKPRLGEHHGLGCGPRVGDPPGLVQPVRRVSVEPLPRPPLGVQPEGEEGQDRVVDLGRVEFHDPGILHRRTVPFAPARPEPCGGALRVAAWGLVRSTGSLGAFLRRQRAGREPRRR